ncbi:Methionine gamma-lyase [Jannaschia seosinensis]|uniref:Methionine gamma-lyase n=1 Tax=Jannaschia seosinensis TaxID=313367 RepID=A0A0M7BCW4_9RHOB|nr:aminotransferase class I/II-fold pyridoxal phosphate-dependent enzyme [Jannaschia seosinensis]CUH40231.1 Methionine gamma-lyase [Jannaschia seosinensis]
MTSDPDIPADFATILTEDSDTGGAAVPPITQTSLFTFDSVDAMEAAFRAPERNPIYTRGMNPTVRAFEKKLAAIERAEDARGFASGMGAISATLLGLLHAGDRVVCVNNVYPDAYRLMTGLMARMGVETVFVDGTDIAAVQGAVKGAKLLYLESPTSMTFDVLDLPSLAAIARAAGAISVIDNSWASPAFQRPIEHGVDLVLHSASKYLSGHSDTVAGVVCGRADLIAQINRVAYPSLGAKLSPFDAWLLIRGMRTLPLRMRQHHCSGLEVATRLAGHPAVSEMRHPGVGGTLDGSTLSGWSSLFAFRMQSPKAARRFCDALRLVRLGVSWGGHESLAFPTQLGLIQPGLTNSFHAFGVSDDMVRLHVGLEDVEDIWRDIEHALEISEAPGEA